MIHLIIEIFHCIMCCVECAEREDERQREIDQVRLAREAEIRRTNLLFHQQHLQQQRCWQPQQRRGNWQPQQPGRIPAGIIVDTRGSMFPAKLKPDPVPGALPSFTHSQRAPPVTRRTSAEHEDGDEAEDTTEFTPLI